MNSGVSAGDIAIFYRNNYSARIFEDELRKLKIPYRIVAGIKFYERKEIKDVLAYLRMLINPKDNLSFTRIINTPPRGIGTVTIRKLENENGINIKKINIIKIAPLLPLKKLSITKHKNIVDPELIIFL